MSALSSPTVSVLLPVRNGGASLDRALASLAAQTFPDWECVVVDDGSSDDTPSRLAAWAVRDARIRPVRLAASGIVGALHAALAAASPHTPYLARMDADDVCRPHRLARQIAFLEAHPEIDLAGCLVGFGGDPVRAGGFARHVAWLNTLIVPEALALARFRDAPLAHPSVCFRRTLPERYGFYVDGPFPEDYELWLRWLEAGAVMAKVPEVLLDWNDSPGRLTRTHPRYSREAFAEIRARYLARYLAARVPAFSDITVWGAGRVSRALAFPLRKYGIRIRALVDVDPCKIGNRIAGIPVLGREALPRPGQGFVAVFLTAHGAAEEAAAFLCAGGYEEGRDFLLCA